MKLYIGLMSGTSMDAIDAALVDFSTPPLALVSYRQLPLADNIKGELRGGGLTADHMGRIDIVLGRSFAAAAKRLLEETGISAQEIAAIGSHGQTVLHSPEGPEPFSLQLGDPNIIAHETGIRTVADFRRRDVAAGGQGAPLASGFHAFMFRDPGVTRAIVNIGGIANITIVPADQDEAVTGCDTGPGNTLLDAWSQEHLHEPFDAEGAWANSGSVHAGLLAKLLEDPYLRRPAPKSTGPEHYNIAWLRGMLESLGETIPAQNVQATLVRFTAETIVAAVEANASNCPEILVCGGGVHNRASISALQDLFGGRTVTSTSAYGLDPDAVEACAFAWLAERRIAGEPGNLPSVTGADSPVVLGAIHSK